MDTLSIMARIERTRFVKVVAVNNDGSVVIRNSSGEHRVSAHNVLLSRGKSHACCDSREVMWGPGAAECGCLHCIITHQTAELRAAPAPELDIDDEDISPDAWIASLGNAILQ